MTDLECAGIAVVAIMNCGILENLIESELTPEQIKRAQDVATEVEDGNYIDQDFSQTVQMLLDHYEELKQKSMNGGLS